MPSFEVIGCQLLQKTVLILRAIDVHSTLFPPQAKLAATNLSSEEASEGEVKSDEDDPDGYLKKMQEIISGGEDSTRSSLKEDKAGREQGCNSIHLSQKLLGKSNLTRRYY